MEKKSVRPPQSSLILRILGGGYLLYLGYDLAFHNSENPGILVMTAAIVFALAGGVLVAATLYQLLTHEYFRQKDEKPRKEEKPSEEQDS